MNNITNFSPNMLKTFDECPQKFFLKYVQKLSIPQRSTIFEKGKKIHALANYYLNGADITKMEKVLTPDEKIVWETLKSNKYFKLDMLNTEYNLSCKVGKYWIGGRLDAFMFNEGTGNREQGTEHSFSNFPLPSSLDYYILDYKTGNIPANAEQDFQTIVYLLCADKLLKKKSGYKSLKFVYLGLKNNVEKEILLDENLKKQYEEKIISTCEKINFAINSNVFTKNDECLSHCEYHKFCNNSCF